MPKRKPYSWIIKKKSLYYIMKHVKNIVLASTAIVLGVILSLLLAWPIVWLWNFSVAPVFDGVHEVTFWQAYCLSLLVSILFRANVKVKSE